MKEGLDSGQDGCTALASSLNKLLDLQIAYLVSQCSISVRQLTLAH